MWYYEQNGNRIGPVDEVTMRSLIGDRTISIDTLVWTNGMANWTPLQQTQLAAGLPVPPPMPSNPSASPYNTAPSQHHPDAKDRVAYVLLAVLLGCGIHNFYAGYNTKGIIQLLVSVLSCGILWFFMWIWAIIEACTVMQDSNGVRFK
ncbi:MAG: GYF domain-containing protein [Verrucomicrobia bacterium]|nr:GYF domain-containing protein [Verrucomicrobiota bacterium]